MTLPKKKTGVVHNSTVCPYCEAPAGEACRVTLAPEVGPLSVVWQHRARTEREEIAK